MFPFFIKTVRSNGHWRPARSTQSLPATSLSTCQNKLALQQTLLNAKRALRCGDALIMIGPNVKYIPGAYWDFL